MLSCIFAVKNEKDVYVSGFDDFKGDSINISKILEHPLDYTSLVVVSSFYSHKKDNNNP